MITGELEYLHGQSEDEYEYDYFFKKLFKKRTAKQKQLAREKRRKFFSQGGKAEEILGGVNSVVRFLEAPKSEEGFEMGLGDEPKEEDTKKKAIPTSIYLVGGAVVVIGGLWAFSHFNKVKKLKK